MQANRCRSCGKEIVWCKTPAGKSMPVDVKPSDTGTVQILPDLNCVIVKAADLDVVRAAKIPLHLSHFATCANAASHRTKGTK